VLKVQKEEEKSKLKCERKLFSNDIKYEKNLPRKRESTKESEGEYGV
jgi:hypothetical protein